MPALRWALAAAVALVAFGGERDAWAVQGGVPDRSTTYAVAIARGAPGTSAVTCSGTLISPDVVLTVRHCFADVVPGREPCDARLGEPRAEDTWVDVAPFRADAAKWKKVRSVRVPEANALCGDDIALLVLEGSVGPHEATPARPVTDAETFRAAVTERVLGLAAFGVTDPRASDLGTRRSRFDIPIRCVPGVPGFTCDDARGFTSDRELTSGSGPCRGDSGAAAILPSDRGVVFGVLSRGEQGAEGTSCTLGVFERTDLWAWLLARTVLDAAAASATPAPAWATALFPERPALGELCAAEDACGDGNVCTSRDGGRSRVCARRCVQDADCSTGERCEAEICAAAPEPPEGDAGCGVAPSPRSDGTALALAAFVIVARLRRALSARTDRRDRDRASS